MVYLLLLHYLENYSQLRKSQRTLVCEDRCVRLQLCKNKPKSAPTVQFSISCSRSSAKRVRRETTEFILCFIQSSSRPFSFWDVFSKTILGSFFLFYENSFQPVFSVTACSQIHVCSLLASVCCGLTIFCLH